MRSIHLTARQQAIVQFMKDHLIHFQRLPTIREISLAFDIRSPNGVACHLRALAAHGVITRGELHHAINYRLNGVVVRLESSDEVDELGTTSSLELSRRSAATNFDGAIHCAPPTGTTTCTVD